MLNHFVVVVAVIGLFQYLYACIFYTIYALVHCVVSYRRLAAADTWFNVRNITNKLNDSAWINFECCAFSSHREREPADRRMNDKQQIDANIHQLSLSLFRARAPLPGFPFFSSQPFYMQRRELIFKSKSLVYKSNIYKYKQFAICNDNGNGNSNKHHSNSVYVRTTIR